MKRITHKDQRMLAGICRNRSHTFEEVYYQLCIARYLLERGRRDRKGAKRYLKEKLGSIFSDRKFRHHLGFIEYLLDEVGYDNLFGAPKTTGDGE